MTILTRLLPCASGSRRRGDQMNWRRVVAAAALPACAIAVMGAKGCGTSTTSTPVNTTSHTSGSAQTVAHVGATLAVAGASADKFNVTLLKVTDPAASAIQALTPEAGKRFVGVKIQIANTGSGALTGDANGDVTIVGSDNQTYTADFQGIAGCTNFNSGSYTLAGGTSSTGCVSFQLPTGVRPVKVEDSPGLGLPGTTTGIWTVP